MVTITPWAPPPSDCLMSYPEHSLSGSLTHLLRYGQCILQLQPTWLSSRVYQIWSLSKNRTRIAPNCIHVNTNVWLYKLEFSKTSGETTRWELYVAAVWCFEKILEAAPYRTAAVWPFTFHLASLNKMFKICWTHLVRYELIRDILQQTSIHGHTSIHWSVRTHINQLSETTGCRLEDLIREMTSRNGFETDKRIRAVSMLWWRWWWWWWWW